MLSNAQFTNSNDITLQSYNNEAMGYIEHTPASYQKHHAPLLHWIGVNLSLISKSERILEIGSGFGREATYIYSKGYDITCSDGTPAFVQYLKTKKWDALTLNILKDEIPEGFSMIFANAVMPHFTPAQFEIILAKVLKALPDGGLFAFSVKQGQGEEWITEKFAAKRFIHYWDPSLLKQYIRSANCKIVFWEEGIHGDLPSHTWINLTIKKRSNPQ